MPGHRTARHGRRRALQVQHASMAKRTRRWLGKSRLQPGRHATHGRRRKMSATYLAGRMFRYSGGITSSES